VRELCDDSGDPAHHQGKRDHEVSCQHKQITPALLTLPREDDSKWPQKNKDGRQELEIRLGSEHISFEVRVTSMSLQADSASDMYDRPRKLAHWLM
jgi:hypothetical protein